MKLSKKKLYYLASPYTADTTDKQHERYVLVTQLAANLMHLHRTPLITPITTSHVMKEYCPELGTKWEYWQHVDLTYISRCDGVLVATMPGWQDSVGVTAEVKYAKRHNIQVLYIDPITLKVKKTP